MEVRGLDVGTMFLVSAKKANSDKIVIDRIRNMFLPVSDDMLTTSEISSAKIDYVESFDEHGELDLRAIIGEDAYKFGNIFGQLVRRPMQKGVISAQEIDAIDILTLMTERLIGKPKQKGFCVYSVPARAIDIEVPPVTYHERVWGTILNSLNFKHQSLNESMAIIFSECQDSHFTGIAISFGAGLTNVACAYKGTPTITFSVGRAGDWIDENVAASLGIVPNRVTSIKEKANILKTDSANKRQRRVQEAIGYYYENLIDYVLKHITIQFNDNAEGLDIDEDIPIIVSGGTSKPAGFLEVFNNVFANQKDFPYSISKVRHAEDPLTAVSQGNLIYALWALEREKEEGKRIDPKKVREIEKKRAEEEK